MEEEIRALKARVAELEAERETFVVNLLAAQAVAAANGVDMLVGMIAGASGSEQDKAQARGIVKDIFKIMSALMAREMAKDTVVRKVTGMHPELMERLGA